MKFHARHCGEVAAIMKPRRLSGRRQLPPAERERLIEAGSTYRFAAGLIRGSDDRRRTHGGKGDILVVQAWKTRHGPAKRQDARRCRALVVQARRDVSRRDARGAKRLIWHGEGPSSLTASRRREVSSNPRRDGRNRYVACQQIGAEMESKEGRRIRVRSAGLCDFQEFPSTPPELHAARNGGGAGAGDLHRTDQRKGKSASPLIMFRKLYRNKTTESNTSRKPSLSGPDRGVGRRSSGRQQPGRGGFLYATVATFMG